MVTIDGEGSSEGGNFDTDQLLASVQSYMDGGNFVQAKKACHEILKNQPFDAEPYNRLGIIAFCEGQNAIALEFFKTALQLNEEIAEYHFSLAMCQLSLGDPICAEIALRKAIGLEPEHIEANMQLGILLSNQGQFGKAVSFFAQVSSLQPGNIEAVARSGLGKVHAHLNDIAGALTKANGELVDDPNNQTALLISFALLLAQDKPEEALDYGEKLVKLDTKNKEYRKNLDIAYKFLASRELNGTQ